MFARKITHLLGKQPQVSDDISARLALARQKAMERVSNPNFIVQNNQLVVSRAKRNFSRMWLVGGLLLLGLISSQNLTHPVNPHYTTEEMLNYNMNADKIDLDFLHDGDQ